jgi:hypothetical protein
MNMKLLTYIHISGIEYIVDIVFRKKISLNALKSFLKNISISCKFNKKCLARK